MRCLGISCDSLDVMVRHAIRTIGKTISSGRAKKGRVEVTAISRNEMAVACALDRGGLLFVVRRRNQTFILHSANFQSVLHGVVAFVASIFIKSR